MSETPPSAATVLVVDDDPFICGIIQKVLTRSGYQVLVAPSGPDAIQRNRNHAGPINLVICDLLMPEMSGQETVRQLLADRPGLRVIYISGFTEDELPAVDLAHPPSLYLAKPFPMAQLLQSVQSLLT